MQVAKWYNDSEGFSEAERGVKREREKKEGGAGNKGLGGSRVHIGESAKQSSPFT
jgi:hypothetical protein